MLYVAFDGDNVGSRLSQLIELGNDDELAQYAYGVAGEMEETAAAAERIGAKVLMCSGDSLLFRMETEKQVHQILQTFHNRKKKFVTYSIGVGRTVQEAHTKLLHAKLLGKNRVVWWREKMPMWVFVRETVRHPIMASKSLFK